MKQNICMPDLPDFIYLNIDDHPVTDMKTPETELIEKERVSGLSSEAVQVLQMILEAPAEILSYGRHKTGISSTCIRNYLVKKLNWKWKTAKRVIKELHAYAHNY